ncbi:MAG: hypothetical protein D6725_11135 [Planctomycetota bacterium]|nr:MAG: hypothetical protein D6725_11135 [Planctomycetota bacterium]
MRPAAEMLSLMTPPRSNPHGPTVCKPHATLGPPANPASNPLQYKDLWAVRTHGGCVAAVPQPLDPVHENATFRQEAPRSCQFGTRRW